MREMSYTHSGRWTALPAGCSVCDDEDGDDIHEGDDDGDEDVEDVDDNNPWGKVVRSRLLEVEKPTSGERATSCLPRVSWENPVEPSLQTNNLQSLKTHI